jgi:hypothetical protein
MGKDRRFFQMTFLRGKELMSMYRPCSVDAQEGRKRLVVPARHGEAPVLVGTTAALADCLDELAWSPQTPSAGLRGLVGLPQFGRGVVARPNCGAEERLSTPLLIPTSLADLAPACAVSPGFDSMPAGLEKLPRRDAFGGI